jgi:hypothetical protein
LLLLLLRWCNKHLDTISQPSYCLHSPAPLLLLLLLLLLE